MDDRLDHLEKTLDRLSGTMKALEARVARLEQAAAPEQEEPDTGAGGSRVAVSTHETPHSEGLPLVLVLSLTGRTFLVLAGAFFLRALTDAEILPHTAGVALGMAYAMAWIVLAYRSGVRTPTISASFYGVAAVLIAYPLIWETTTKLAVLSPAVSASIIAAVTAIFMLVAWRRSIYPLAWAVTIAVLVTCPALIFSTASMELFTAPLLLIGALTVWLAYSRGWRIMRWLTAFVADVVVVLMVYLATRSSEYPGRFGHLSAAIVMGFAVGILLIYLGSFALHTLVRRKEITAFEVMQSAGALMAGFGGAIHVSRTMGSGGLALGISALTAGGACYAVAFAFVSRRLEKGVNFFFYAWLALVLTLLGSWLVIGEGLLSPGWMVLAIAAAYLGGRFDRITLRAHCAVYSLAAAWQSGLMETGLAAFTAPHPESWPTLTVVILAMTVVCYALLALTQMGREVRWIGRLPRSTVLVLSVLGIGASAVVLLARFLPGVESARPGDIAVIRTAVLACSAVALAIMGPRTRLAEMSWLVYPVLLAGGIKLLIEDLAKGRPITIFLGFVFYGIALITAPRVLRTARDSRK